MPDRWTIGIIGGSGLYEIDGLDDAQWIAVSSPFGAPSDEILCGRIGEVAVRFLPRHGRGHRIAPSSINARANIDALKRAGCTDILAFSAVGSLREDIKPGTFCVVDQFVDVTRGRPQSFFGDGFVAHVSMADPVCARLSKIAAKAVRAAKGKVETGAAYVAIEGPQFSTRAESLLYQQWGGDVVGMTAMPEARLAREAELPYALVAMVTDYDSWRSAEAAAGEADAIAEVVAQIEANRILARATIDQFIAALPKKRSASPIDRALDDAVITASEHHDRARLARLDAVAGRLLGRF